MNTNKEEPKLRSAEEWTEIRDAMPLSYTYEDPPDVVMKEFASFLSQVQQNAITFTRYKALTEAAETASNNMMDRQTKEAVAKAILKLRDTTKEGK